MNLTSIEADRSSASAAHSVDLGSAVFIHPSSPSDQVASSSHASMLPILNTTSGPSSRPCLRTKRARRIAVRIAFVAVNIVLFFAALLVLVDVMQEMGAEEDVVASQAATSSTGAPDASQPNETAAWKERYVLLGEDVYGSNYRIATDIYFAFLLVATFSGAFGALLRRRGFVWFAVLCYLPAFGFTIAAMVGIHQQLNAEARHSGSIQARYRAALAWTCVTLLVLSFLFVVGVLHARTMVVTQQEASRYRTVAAAAAASGSPRTPSRKRASCTDHVALAVDDVEMMTSPEVPLYHRDNSV